MSQSLADALEHALMRDSHRIRSLEVRARAGVHIEERETRDLIARSARIEETRGLLYRRGLQEQREQLNEFFRGRRGKVLDNVMDPWAPDHEARALSKLTGGAGANTVGQGFVDQVVFHLSEVSGIARGARTLMTAKGDALPMPTTTAHSSGALVAEGATIPTSEPTFGQRSLGAYKFGAKVDLSQELEEDTSIDMVDYLGLELGRALGVTLGGYLATGTGSAQPAGLVPNATVAVTGGTGVSGAPTADNVLALFYSLIAPCRELSTTGWVMRDTTLLQVRQLKGSDGQYVFPVQTRADGVELLLGKPVWTDPFVPAIGLGNRSIIFGDLYRFVVRLVAGLRLERATGPGFNNGTIQYRALLRADSVLADTSGAVRAFVGGAS
ncbi:phage major capsid protein [Cryptosporangium arvum]|uniref:Putative phage phi-C31 gp36 major capsid-like protein n=1 Tax=Cryptosporangium arvum DSM 44712 TaxID=927661 RepID=A0A011AD87_9ACTN|nr:phage major capsid protein [Cryptosporangium arvum]EXG80021.1 putative phage phi-C31 gp36 major capsid-like protein [Cryptosporangium arvum DSM 44712]